MLKKEITEFVYQAFDAAYAERKISWSQHAALTGEDFPKISISHNLNAFAMAYENADDSFSITFSNKLVDLTEHQRYDLALHETAHIVCFFKNWYDENDLHDSKFHEVYHAMGGCVKLYQD